MKRLRQQLRPTMDTFNFWVGIAYFGLVAVVVALYFLNQNTAANIRRTAADEATHAAEIRSSAESRYSECLNSIPVLVKINRFIEGERIVDGALVENSEANLAATPSGSALYATRVANLRRLRAAKAAAFEVKFPVPTRAACAALRRRLLAQQ